MDSRSLSLTRASSWRFQISDRLSGAAGDDAQAGIHERFFEYVRFFREDDGGLPVVASKLLDRFHVSSRGRAINSIGRAGLEPDWLVIGQAQSLPYAWSNPRR